jgi:hypothetical protein
MSRKPAVRALFTAIKGLGCLAEKIGKEATPSPKQLLVLQTCFGIISDDLSNTHTSFKKGAPLGPRGIHYKWWEDTILNPLRQEIGNIHIDNLSSGTSFLILQMQQLSTNYLGVAVQLRVVEAIALDICKAFLALFSNTQHQGRCFFNKQRDLIWITSHIEAEKLHHKQVCDEFSGVAGVASTLSEQNKLLDMIRQYADAWKTALDGLDNYIKKP